MKRFLTIFLTLVLAFTFCTLQTLGQTDTPDEEQTPAEVPEIQSGAALVMDANTGSVLYQKNMTDKHSPADIAQVMTILLALEENKTNETVTVTREILDTVDREGAHISLQEGEEVKIKDLLYGIMLSSASDAAKVVATALAGSESAFAEKMTARMKELGAVNSSFVNADGEPAENNFSTAQDIALLTKEALKNDAFKEIFSKTSHTMDATNKNASERSFTTICLLMKNSDMDVKYEHVVGGKSGWNKDAGYTLVSAAEQDGRTLICVILDAKSSEQRYKETIALFDYAFAAFRNVSVPSTLLSPTEIPVMKNGTIVRKILVSIPEGTLLSTNVEFQEGTMTVSSLPAHVTEGDTSLRLTVSAKDRENNTVVLGTVILDIETKELDLGETPGGEKKVPLSVGAKIWRVIRTILLVILCIIGGIILIAAALFLVSYLQRRKRQALRRRRIREKQMEEEAEALKQVQYTGRRHKQMDD